MPHAVLIAVIFVLYFGLMLVFLAAACAMGRPPRRDDHDDGQDEAAPRPSREPMDLAA